MGFFAFLKNLTQKKLKLQFVYNYFQSNTKLFVDSKIFKWANESTRKNPLHYLNCHRPFHLDDPTQIKLFFRLEKIT